MKYMDVVFAYRIFKTKVVLRADTTDGVYEHVLKKGKETFAGLHYSSFAAFGDGTLHLKERPNGDVSVKLRADLK